MQRAATASSHVSEAAERHRNGERADAARLYHQALALDPDNADALHGLGCLAHEAGHHAVAVALIGRALQARPRTGHYHVVLGLALFAEGQVEAARAALALACLHEPRDWRAQAAHGRVLASLGRTEDALAAFDRSLAHHPGQAETEHERAVLLLAAGRTETACEGFRAAHALRPDDPATAANLGAALQALNRPEEAEPFLSKSLDAAPDRPETLSTRGLVRLSLGSLDAALDDLGRAHALAPGNQAITRHLALCRYERDDRAGARALLDAVIAGDPADQAARYNLGLLDLAEGDYEAGWRGFEGRHGLGPAREPVDAWNGESRSLPLRLVAEQGLGDTLQFLRYATPAARRAGAATLSLPNTLRRAVSGLGLPWTEATPGPVLPLGSLPRLFSRSPNEIPSPFACWHDERAASRWSERLRALKPGAISIGLAWAGSPGYRQDRRRSIAPALLLPLLDLPGLQFVSLQRDATMPGVLDPGAELHDLAETAALIMALDVVVTVDTAIVHLAAGLGKPTWLLDRAGGDWRWLRGREDSPWYPSLRIFRQPTAEVSALAWPPVIERVRAELQALTASDRR